MADWLRKACWNAFILSRTHITTPTKSLGPLRPEDELKKVEDSLQTKAVVLLAYIAKHKRP